MDTKTKRIRSAVFSNKESEILLDLCYPNRDIIESKKTNRSSIVAKDEVWENITKEFNRKSDSIFRNCKTLKVKYDNLKRRTKIVFSGTENLEITPLDIKMKEILGDSIQGIASEFTIINPETNEAVASIEEEEEPLNDPLEHHVSAPPVIDVVNVEPNFADFTHEIIKRPRSFALVPTDILSKLAKNEAAQSGGEMRSNHKKFPDCVQKQQDILNKNRPFNKSSPEKEVWENVGRAKLEFIKLKIEIAEEQRKLHLEHHSANMKYMAEEHEMKMKILQAELNLKNK